VFKLGVIAKLGDLTNYGTGPGRDFQALEKNCPAFAAEFTAVALRHIRTHWGTINSHAAEVKPDCDAMLLAVRNAVDASPGLCAALQAYRLTVHYTAEKPKELSGSMISISPDTGR
jgi:hypothetical protein